MNVVPNTVTVLNGEVMEVCSTLGNLSANSRRHMQELGKALDVRAALVSVAEMLTSTQLMTVRVAELVYILSEMSRPYIIEQRRSDVSNIIQMFSVVVKMK